MKTFVVRLHEVAGDQAGGDRVSGGPAGGTAGADSPRLRGVVDEVATGLRTTFRSELELITALKAAMDTAPPD